jgi:hypothetical protein
MTSGWKFFERRPNDKVRDPIQGEFFAAEGEGESYEALVREAIQNSLDAAISPGVKPVKVRIRVGEISAAHVASFMTDAWKHVAAAGNGLRNKPTRHESCRYIAIEDFETSGLEGDETATSQVLSRKNGFFCFFRAEGVSEKQGDDRGRWGLGKTVFPKTSRMNAMFGLTVRHSDRKRFLMGNIALKTRSVDGKEWTPDGWFGRFDHNQTVVPTADLSELGAFEAAFSLARGDLPGLSVVIPFVDTDLSVAGLASRLEREVARAYFIPILRGQLVVEVIAADSTLVDVARVRALCEGPDFPGEEAAIVSLALASTHGGPQGAAPYRFHVSAPPDDRQDWTEFAFAEADANDLRTRLERGEIVDFQMSVKVCPKGRDTHRDSTFTLLLRRDESVTKSVGRFVREGITITRERAAPNQTGLVSLVEIGPGPLASALGDAENPAHTVWNPKSNDGRMKENYTHAPALLAYVRGAANALTQAIYRHASPDDELLLADFFPEELLDDGRQAPTASGRKKPKRVGLPPPLPVPKSRLIRVESGNRGEFAVLPGGAAYVPGTSPRVRVRVAYDRESGNPLSKWNAADFVLSPQVLRERKGLKLLRCEGNQIEFEIESPDFALRVGGFDERRDLIVSSTVAGGNSDSQD